MREAFPSLPFGSPALDRDFISTTTSTITSNTATITAAYPQLHQTNEILKEDLPRIIDRDSGGVGVGSSSTSGYSEGTFYIFI